MFSNRRASTRGRGNAGCGCLLPLLLKNKPSKSKKNKIEPRWSCDAYLNIWKDENSLHSVQSDDEEFFRTHKTQERGAGGQELAVDGAGAAQTSGNIHDDEPEQDGDDYDDREDDQQTDDDHKEQ